MNEEKHKIEWVNNLHKKCVKNQNASALASIRWSKTAKADRLAHSQMMNKAKRLKRLKLGLGWKQSQDKNFSIQPEEIKSSL